MADTAGDRVADDQRRTTTALLTLEHGRLLHVQLHQGARVDLAAAEENHHATMALCPSGRIVVLVDSRPAKLITRDARIYLADQRIRSNTLAQAILIDSGPSRVMGNFFLGINRPAFPVKLFNDERKARTWLDKFVD